MKTCESCGNLITPCEAEDGICADCFDALVKAALPSLCAVYQCDEKVFSDPNDPARAPSDYCPWHESDRLLGLLPKKRS